MSSVCAARHDRAHARAPRRRAARALLAEDEWVPALGAMTGGQAVQMVKAGLRRSTSPAGRSQPTRTSRATPIPTRASTRRTARPRSSKRINSALLRADQITHAEGDDSSLARADRGRRRGRVRRPAQRLRDHEVVHRGRRSGSPLRGSALLREEVRPPRRQGARSHRPAHPHARRGAACGRRLQRADADRRAHGCPLRLAADERHRRHRPRVLHRRAHAGGLLPRPRRHRRGDRPRPRLRAVLPT